MQILDSILAKKINDFIDDSLPLPPGTYEAARPRTQPLDIAHGLQTVLERALDNRSEGAIAQCDIKQFYDNIPTLRCMRYLEARGLGPVFGRSGAATPAVFSCKP